MQFRDQSNVGILFVSTEGQMIDSNAVPLYVSKIETDNNNIFLVYALLEKVWNNGFIFWNACNQRNLEHVREFLFEGLKLGHLFIFAEYTVRSTSYKITTTFDVWHQDLRWSKVNPGAFLEFSLVTSLGNNKILSISSDLRTKIYAKKCQKRIFEFFRSKNFPV